MQSLLHFSEVCLQAATMTAGRALGGVAQRLSGKVAIVTGLLLKHNIPFNAVCYSLAELDHFLWCLQVQPRALVWHVQLA